MRRIDAFLTLALSAALILVLGGTCGTSEEDISDTGKPPGAEVAPPYDWTPTDEWTPPPDRAGVGGRRDDPTDRS